MLGGNLNLPRPNGFIFASKGKRSAPSANEDMDIEEVKRSPWWNVPKPNLFFYPSVPLEDYSDEDNLYQDPELVSLLSSIFKAQNSEEDDEIPTSKRDNFDESTFFAGRGKRGDDVDLDSFFAGRGKKDVDADLAAFFAGRGKKAGDVGDIFFAGRG